MVKNTEGEGLREMTQHGDLPSLAAGECPGRDDLYTVMDGLYRLPGQWQRDSCIMYSYCGPSSHTSWCGVAQYGAAWLCMVRRDLAWCGVT